MDDKGIAFTTDILLALVIVTVAIGLVTDQFEALSYKMSDFAGRQSLEKTATDAADFLVKSPGEPERWERQPTNLNALPGLATIDEGRPVSNFLFNSKVVALKNRPVLMENLVHTSNYRLVILHLNGTPLFQIGNTVPSNAKEVAVANRTCVLLPGEALFSMYDLMHINPANPANNTTFLWYNKQGVPSIYVGPGNKTTEVDPDSSFNLTPADFELFEYYIRIDSNTGVRSVEYGFTDGDAVVNGTYGAFDDKNRREAINAELDRVYGPPGWIKIGPGDLRVGSFIPMNPALNQTLRSGAGPDLKLWIQVESDPKDDFSLTLVRVYKGQSYTNNRVPVKLVLYVWE